MDRFRLSYFSLFHGKFLSLARRCSGGLPAQHHRNSVHTHVSNGYRKRYRKALTSTSAWHSSGSRSPAVSSSKTINQLSRPHNYWFAYAAKCAWMADKPFRKALAIEPLILGLHGHPSGNAIAPSYQSTEAKPRGWSCAGVGTRYVEG